MQLKIVSNIKMNIEKVKTTIKKRSEATKAEYDLQVKLHEKDPKYALPDYGWFNGRITAFNEALELIGMIDKPNNK